MYEAFFGLQRRPFASAPDPSCWFRGEPCQAAFDELLFCALHGQGIGVLVAPAGLGKTLIGERLARELSQDSQVVYLRHATFSTRRSLLQAILCELRRPVDKLSDLELRLAVFAAIQELHSTGSTLSILVDEAHRLTEAALDELRILADQSQHGRPLVRLTLLGQLSLEEQLALPGSQAFNQRIRALVALPGQSRADSAEYIDFRITWAGGRTAEVFRPEAVDLICQASDGVPRCINQLCDHVLLSAFASEERPASAATVRAALQDLRYLSLPWNSALLDAPESKPLQTLDVEFHANAPEAGERSEVLECLAGPQCEESVAAAASNPMDTSDVSVYRLSHRWDFEGQEQSAVPVFADATPPQWTVDEPMSTPTDADDMTDLLRDEPVLDRYNALDAGLTPPAMNDSVPRRSLTATWEKLWREPGAADRLAERIAAVQHVLDVVAGDDCDLPGTRGKTDRQDSNPHDDYSTESQIHEMVRELSAEAHEHLPAETPRSAQSVSGAPVTCYEVGAEIAVEALESREHSELPTARRAVGNLFTRLRRKQQGRS